MCASVGFMCEQVCIVVSGVCAHVYMCKCMYSEWYGGWLCKVSDAVGGCV